MVLMQDHASSIFTIQRNHLPSLGLENTTILLGLLDFSILRKSYLENLPKLMGPWLLTSALWMLKMVIMNQGVKKHILLNMLRMIQTLAPTCPPLVGSIFSIKQKNKKSPGKKHVKDKAKRARATGDDEIAASISMLAKSIASTCPATTDPYADLWKCIEDIPFPPRDKVDIATYLSKPEQVHLRNYLNAASDQSFGIWVTDYLGAKYRVNGVDDGEYGTSM